MLGACGGAGSFFAPGVMCRAVMIDDIMYAPDGSQLYFDAEIIPDQPVTTIPAPDIYVMDSQGKDLRVLIHGAAYPMPSPDGKLLLYQPLTSLRESNPGYSILDLATLKSRRVIDVPATPAWSPDGQWIAYGTNNGPVIRLDPGLDTRAPMTDSPFGGLVSDHLPLWSPDGRRIAFWSDRETPGSYVGDIYLADVGSPDAPGAGHTTRLDVPPVTTCKPGEQVGYRALAWSPDGKRLAYMNVCSHGAGEETLHVTALDGQEEPGWSALGYVLGFQWSPDGSHALMIRHVDFVDKLTVTDGDGRNDRTLLTGILEASWSPDGKLIVYVDYAKTGSQEVFTMNPDGTDITQITPNQAAGGMCFH